MSDIFREVDDALQQDKLLNIWHEYKTTIIGAIALLIISAGITTFYKQWDYNQDAKNTAHLMTALDSDTPKEQLSALNKGARKNHATTANLIAASIALEDGKKEEAVTIYKQIADNSKAPRDLRDLARLFYIKHAAEPDIKTIKPLLADEKSPWIWHARIEAAVIEAKQNNYAKAITHLDHFKNSPGVLLSLKQRGENLRKLYEIKQAQENTQENTQAKETTGE